jgi:hypothetical protein
MMLRHTFESASSEEIDRLVRRQHLSSSTTFRSVPEELHDPIFTPLFTSLFTSLGLTATAAGVAATVSTAIVTTALSIGLQMLLAPKPPTPEDGKIPLTQPLPYRQWMVGRNRVAGAMMLWDAKGNALCAVQAIAGHRIKSVNRFYLHDDEVTLAAGGYVNGLGSRYGNNRAQIFYRLGLVPETAYSEIVNIMGGDGVWTSAHRGDGQASLGMIALNSSETKQQKRFPYGAPRLSVEADGAYIFDPRDPAQSVSNPNTWTWSRNSALIILWHLCFNPFSYRLDYTKAILPVVDMWKEEADICDENVPRAGGGSEKRYECNGFDTTENGPKAGLNAMLATCDGHLVTRGDGARILTVGKFRESRCVTLDDRDIIGHRVNYDVLFEDETNRIVPKFTYPDTDYTTSDTDFFEDVPAQLAAGRVLSQEANYQFCQQWRQARRLGKRDFLRERQKVRGSIDVRLSGINSVYARWVRLSTPIRMPKLDGSIVENRHAVLSITRGGFSMDIVQNPPDIDNWTPATDEGQQPPVPPKANASDIVTPVINLVQAKPSGSSVYIRVVIIDPADDSLTPAVRYRLADAGSGSPGAWVTQDFPDATASGGYIDLATGIVPSNKLLDIQAAFKTSKGDYGNWSVTANVTSTVDPTAPGTPTNLLAPNSATTVPVSARAANDNTAYLIFKRGTTGQTFAAATQIGRYAATGNQVISLNDTPGAGTWKYWCGAENSSGIPSSAQASVTTVVT